MGHKHNHSLSIKWHVFFMVAMQHWCSHLFLSACIYSTCTLPACIYVYLICSDYSKRFERFFFFFFLRDACESPDIKTFLFGGSLSPQTQKNNEQCIPRSVWLGSELLHPGPLWPIWHLNWTLTGRSDAVALRRMCHSGVTASDDTFVHLVSRRWLHWYFKWLASVCFGFILYYIVLRLYSTHSVIASLTVTIWCGLEAIAI